VKKVWVLLAMAVGLGLIGCGGSDDAEPLSKAEFKKQATAICEKSRQERYDKVDALPKNVQSNKQELKKLIQSEFIPSFRAMYDELRELNPPEAEAEEFEKVLASLEAAIDKTESNFGETEALFGANQKVEKMGLAACGF